MPVTLAVLCVLAADAGASALSPRFAVPGAAQLARLADVIDDSGHPQHAWSAKSPERIDTLARHYAREMTRAGLYVAPAAEQVHFEGAFQLTGIELKTKLAHTVLVFPEKAGGCAVVLAQTELAQTLKPQSVPLPEGARQLAAFQSEGVVTVLFEADLEPAALERFFKQTRGVEKLELVTVKKGLTRGALRLEP